MEAFILEEIIVCDRIDVFHHEMFHGEATRKSPIASWPAYTPSHNLGDDLSDPLQIIRNGKYVPDVFLPATSLVVSSRVKKELEQLSNVLLIEVEFLKLINLVWNKGDYSYQEKSDRLSKLATRDPERLLEILPDEPELHAKIGQYYEVVVPIIERISPLYKPLKKVKYRRLYLGTEEDAAIRLSKSMLIENPIIWIKDGTIFNRNAFERVAPFVDWEFFTKVELQI